VGAYSTPTGGATSIDGLSDAIANANSVFLGSTDGAALTTGISNTSCGIAALAAVTSGNYNVAVGHMALNTATSAANCIALGYNSQVSNTQGTDNISIGYAALDAINSSAASRIVAIGSDARGSITKRSKTAYL